MDSITISLFVTNVHVKKPSFDLSGLQCKWIKSNIFQCISWHILGESIDGLQKVMFLTTAGNEDVVPSRSMSNASTIKTSTSIV